MLSYDSPAFVTLPQTPICADEDAELRSQLEAEFHALCEREKGLMVELAALTAVEE